MKNEAYEAVDEEPAVQRFIETAERYCKLVELCEQQSKAAFLNEVQRVLFALCFGAMSLPDLEVETERLLESRVSKLSKFDHCARFWVSMTGIALSSIQLILNIAIRFLEPFPMTLTISIEI